MKTTVLSYSLLSALLTFSSAAHAVQTKTTTATPHVHVQPPNVGIGGGSNGATPMFKYRLTQPKITTHSLGGGNQPPPDAK